MVLAYLKRAERITPHKVATIMPRRPTEYPHTPDGRYFVVRGRLWRASNPGLDTHTHDDLVRKVMSARRAIKEAGSDIDAKAAARRRVDEAKIKLVERGLPWWSDGTPDLNRRMARNTPYAAWYAALQKPT